MFAFANSSKKMGKDIILSILIFAFMFTFISLFMMACSKDPGRNTMKFFLTSMNKKVNLKTLQDLTMCQIEQDISKRKNLSAFFEKGSTSFQTLGLHMVEIRIRNINYK